MNIEKDSETFALLPQRSKRKKSSLLSCLAARFRDDSRLVMVDSLRETFFFVFLRLTVRLPRDGFFDGLNVFKMLLLFSCEWGVFGTF